MSLAPEEKIVFNKGGPSAVANFDAGVAGFEARAFRGLGIFTSTPFEVSDDADSMQMLQRSTQVGEFYYMMSPAVGWTDNDKHKGYLDIIIYDEEADKHVHIPFHKACEAAGLVTVTTAADGKRTYAQSNEVDANKMPKTPWAARAKDICGNNDNGEYVPGVCMVIARPFIEHLMMSAVMTVSGRDTGATLFGPADMQISANTSVKTIEGHYVRRNHPQKLQWNPMEPKPFAHHAPVSCVPRRATPSRSSPRSRTCS